MLSTDIVSRWSQEKNCCGEAINYYRSHVLPALAMASLHECVDLLPSCGEISATCASVLDTCLDTPPRISSFECHDEDDTCVCKQEIERLEPVAECVGEKGCCQAYNAWCHTRNFDHPNCEADCRDTMSSGAVSTLQFIAGIAGLLFVAGVLGMIY